MTGTQEEEARRKLRIFSAPPDDAKNLNLKVHVECRLRTSPSSHHQFLSFLDRSPGPATETQQRHDARDSTHHGRTQDSGKHDRTDRRHVSLPSFLSQICFFSRGRWLGGLYSNKERERERRALWRSWLFKNCSRRAAGRKHNEPIVARSSTPEPRSGRG